VTPGFGITAREAYAAARIGLTERASLTKVSCSALREGERGALERALRNDLEAGVILARPEVAEIKAELLKFGAVAAALSGSGPTVYGVVRGRAEGDSVAGLLSGRGRTIHVVEPIDIGHSAAWEERGGGHTS
jgi:4-diphosphocytidyl-2-C-methyl-D-erythritol kinase